MNKISNFSKHAIVVGINDYKDNKIPGLAGAVNDASDIYNRLQNPEVGGYQILDEHRLIGQDATSIKIRKALSDVFYRTDETSDLAIFFFSGHGFEDAYQEGYIVPYDMQLDEPFVHGIRMDELKQIISNAVKIGHVRAAVAILDCCYSGIATKGTKGVASPKLSFCERVNEISQCEGVVVLASSGEEETSKELALVSHNDGLSAHPHGLFTSILLEALDGNASDEFGRVRLDKLNDYIDRKLRALGKQRPLLSMEKLSSISEWEIVKCPKKFKEKIAQTIKAANASYEKDNPTCLILAAIDIENLLQINPGIQDAINLKQKVEARVSNNQDQANMWLVDNEFNVCPEIPDVFNELSKFVDRRRLEDIVNLKKEQQIMLANLWRVSAGQISDKQFILKCKYYDQCRKTPSKELIKTNEKIKQTESEYNISNSGNSSGANSK